MKLVFWKYKQDTEERRGGREIKRNLINLQQQKFKCQLSTKSERIRKQYKNVDKTEIIKKVDLKIKNKKII